MGYYNAKNKEIIQNRVNKTNFQKECCILIQNP